MEGLRIRGARGATSRMVLMHLFQTAENPPIVWRYYTFALDWRRACAPTARVVGMQLYCLARSRALLAVFYRFCSVGAEPALPIRGWF